MEYCYYNLQPVEAINCLAFGLGLLIGTLLLQLWDFLATL
jgi:hypothetical protein